MRVLYCTDTYVPQVNGVSVVTDASARGLIARGWEVEVVAPWYPAALARGARAPGTPFGETRTGPRVHATPSFPAPRYPELRVAIPAPWRMARIVRAFAPDLVHCATEFAIGRVGLWAARRRGIPVVTSYHTNFGQYARAYGLGGLRSSVERYIASVHRAARRTYTPSTAARAELWRMGVSDVEVWGRGVDLALFSPDQRSGQVRAQLGVNNAFTFVYVGRLAPEKSVDIVLRAFARLTETVGRDVVRLVVAGSGPEEIALRERAPRGTVFIGTLDRCRELPALYASADAFVFASETETLGLVVLEAMASGLPVIAVPGGGVADHLRDGENGIATPPRDVEAMAQAMHRLATTAGMRERLSDGALRTARALGWDAEIDRLDASYRGLCEEVNTVRNLPVRLGLRRA